MVRRFSSQLTLERPKPQKCRGSKVFSGIGLGQTWALQRTSSKIMFFFVFLCKTSLNCDGHCNCWMCSNNTPNDTTILPNDFPFLYSSYGTSSRVQERSLPTSLKTWHRPAEFVHICLARAILKRKILDNLGVSMGVSKIPSRNG